MTTVTQRCETPALASRPRARTIPSLDGLRAVSIVLVLVAHAQGTTGFPRWMPSAVADHGGLGVQIFFVISGFLITSLLLQEEAGTGAISLVLFYARRTLRIFPPLYFYLAVLAVATWIGILHVPAINFLFAATYMMNYRPATFWITNHLWSLSVEEQFYLLWPLTIKLGGVRRALKIAAAIAVGAPLVNLIVYLVNHNVGTHLTKDFPFVADSIAAGCVLAGVLPWLRRRQVFQWVASPLGDLVIPLIFLLDLGRYYPRIRMAFEETAMNVCICYAIVRYTEFPKGAIGKLLNNRVLTYVGRLSYSLYLWQQLFVNPTDPSKRFPLNIALSLFCALASYYLLELPLAGVRRRFRPAIGRACRAT